MLVLEKKLRRSISIAEVFVGRGKSLKCGDMAGIKIRLNREIVVMISKHSQLHIKAPPKLARNISVGFSYTRWSMDDLNKASKSDNSAFTGFYVLLFPSLIAIKHLTVGLTPHLHDFDLRRDLRYEAICSCSAKRWDIKSSTPTIHLSDLSSALMPWSPSNILAFPV